MHRLLILCAIVAIACLVAGQEISRIGPQPGQKVPDFSLVDQNGRTHTLASLMGPKGTMLVFYRSADW